MATSCFFDFIATRIADRAERAVEMATRAQGRFILRGRTLSDIARFRSDEAAALAQNVS
jgi:hypothetical protein